MKQLIAIIYPYKEFLGFIITLIDVCGFAKFLFRRWKENKKVIKKIATALVMLTLTTAGIYFGIEFSKYNGLLDYANWTLDNAQASISEHGFKVLTIPREVDLFHDIVNESYCEESIVLSSGEHIAPKGAEVTLIIKKEEVLKEDEVPELLEAIPDVRNTLFFGKYEQDNSMQNGAEPIEWIVLKTNDRKVTLISKNALDNIPFHNQMHGGTWDKSDVRVWLNSVFTDRAFSEDELECIYDTNVVADVNPEFPNSDPGGNSIDKVFLLSVQEASTLFWSDEDRRCEATEYAQNAGVRSDAEGCWWRLRTCGKFETGVTSIGFGGQIQYEGDTVIDVGYGIRPVIVLDYDKFMLLQKS